MSLDALGLRPGEAVRWRRRGGAHWQVGTLERLERDGSLGVRDEKGASRALKPDVLEVRTVGARGAAGWEPVAGRAARAQQLTLL